MHGGAAAVGDRGGICVGDSRRENVVEGEMDFHPYKSVVR